MYSLFFLCFPHFLVAVSLSLLSVVLPVSLSIRYTVPHFFFFFAGNCVSHSKIFLFRSFALISLRHCCSPTDNRNRAAEPPSAAANSSQTTYTKIQNRKKKLPCLFPGILAAARSLIVSGLQLLSSVWVAMYSGLLLGRSFSLQICQKMHTIEICS